MLPRVVTAAASALLLGLLAGCSGPAPAPADADPSAAARDAVRATFLGYGQALLRRDFAGACNALTDDARRRLVADLNTKNIPAQTCEQAYAALYATEAAGPLDDQGRSIRVVDVTVDGATATLTYTGTVKGRPLPPQTARAVQVPGGWQIAASG